MTRKIDETDIAKRIDTIADPENYWMDFERVVTDLSIPSGDFEKILSTSHEIIMNDKGKITTRRLYRKNEPFLGKLLDSIRNKIE